MQEPPKQVVQEQPKQVVQEPPKQVVQEPPKQVVQEPAKPAASNDVNLADKPKSWKDLTGYPVFPAGTKSLLAKYLTRDVWNKLHDK